MSHSSELNSYIAQVERRLRLGAWLRGAAAFAGTALVVTLALVMILNRLAFPVLGVAFGRVTLSLTLAAAAVLGLTLPLVRLTRAWAVGRAERAHPELEHRLTTFADRAGKANDPFLELLAADTLARTREVQPSALVPANRLFALGGGGLACLGVLMWMIAAGPGYFGYGASLLWAGGKKNAAPLYALSVTPGDITVRRNSDQLIAAHVKGMQPEKTQLFARYRSASGWEPVAMQLVPGPPGGPSYQFVFAGLPEDVEYYVRAGPMLSPRYKIRVVDLPSVKDIRVTYKYPAWTGMRPVTEEHSGDLRAIEGTEAQIELQTDRPLKNGELMLDGGQTINLAGGERNLYRAELSMEKDGAYHVSATDEGQAVRLSEDYFIATDKAMPPEISIARPGGDYRASPIEEVTLGLKGTDEFGLRDMHLHYSLNGGSDHDVNLLKTPGRKSADGSYTLPLEDFKLKPGDLVSVYATAKDGHSEARTDISFIQVDPFEREFSQSQQSGGGGGGGNGGNRTEISKREKELIEATWKQQNDKSATPKDAAAQGQLLSDAQRKLRDQVNALSLRIQSRDISEANSEFTDFDKDMQDAAAAMAPSADQLKEMQWKDAIPLEQKALQALLRAEATFQKIQVAFGQAGGGGGGGNAGRDLASLFDLELDTEKNQYETAQSISPAEKREKDLDDALQKLDALAKRQEDLASQPRNPQQNFAQRWQQEMLRREAEQLQHQLEQMTQNGQQNSQGSSSQSGKGSSDAASGAPSDQRIEQALSRLRQAAGAMPRGDNSASQNADGARQAAESLREAQNLLAGSQQQLASRKLDSLAREAERLRQDERSQAERINHLADSQNEGVSPNDLDAFMSRRRERDQLAGERQRLSDSLSTLQRNLRDSARTMAPNQPGAAQKLRDTLAEMDDADLENRAQRTADWLRLGISPNANGTESAIAQGLDELSRNLKQAHAGVAQEKPGRPGSSQGDQSTLINQVEQLREQIQAMSRSQGTRAGVNTDQSGAQQLSPPQSPQVARGGEAARFGGDLGNQMRAGASGDIRDGGAAADSTVWNNVNTGNNRHTSPRRAWNAPPDATGNPADSERAYQQEMRQLGKLRQMVQGDPQTAKEVAELTRQMEHLDPSRFPGNPAIVAQMHREALSSVDKLELELERAGARPQARTGKPDGIPPGFQDAVADYYKRLSSQVPH
jgi:hypothetical protein